MGISPLIATVDQVSKLLDAVGTLVSAVAWPALVLLLVWWFRGPLRGLMADVRTALREGRATVKAGPSGIEVSTTQAAVLIQRAQAQKSDADGLSVVPGEDSSTIANAVEGIADAVRSEQGEAPRILWVDDSPANNELEEQALAKLGLQIHACLSTNEALLQLSREHFELVITDLGRPGDRHAGYTLLDEMRKRGDDTPVVIYTARASAADREEAKRRGAIGRTVSPRELVQLVSETLVAQNGPRRRHRPPRSEL